ncbi:hypothetical protein CPT_Metamorpho_132 [Klebsiella phage Metamorpho]|nr:hypothetical protein CPT_Metamorpho_132 [Klebsiella phage Metamorpho]
MYALLTWSNYYPAAGSNQIRGVYSTVEECYEALQGTYEDYFEILNSQFETVATGSTDAYKD